ncbi:uncharacterized protein BO97DRAFT_278623 [Aspergillus homomorphus CBS 101889]|uniref:Uncharacterized protein n=1 Tax=Aspergillus homomorphus (strain CBS 101889) TaxID=1450537 RepID=A0A395HKQ9_ASPHC|nr:hypothetical protein BO97DRAFT_278623 [Aspergillus homomorphus CBS 101889]RAL06854.1 hypothetical protein BO97DRAFT_278623 [Aspergillus homomorphus CBS 101889]
MRHCSTIRTSIEQLSYLYSSGMMYFSFTLLAWLGLEKTIGCGGAAESISFSVSLSLSSLLDCDLCGSFCYCLFLFLSSLFPLFSLFNNLFCSLFSSNSIAFVLPCVCVFRNLDKDI